MSRILIRILLFGLFCTSALAESGEEPLTTVRVLEYLSFSGESYHHVVRKVLVNNIDYVVEQISTSSTNKDFSYFKNIEARDTGEPIHKPKKDPQRYWSDKDMSVLAVLYGEVGEVERTNGDGKILVAASSIYIGDLPSRANSIYSVSTFRVPLELRLKSFNELADSHSFISAYALLLDAVRRGAPKHVQFAIVNACDQIFDRLESNLYQTSELSEVAKAIEAISKLIGSP